MTIDSLLPRLIVAFVFFCLQLELQIEVMKAPFPRAIMVAFITGAVAGFYFPAIYRKVAKYYGE